MSPRAAAAFLGLLCLCSCAHTPALSQGEAVFEAMFAARLAGYEGFTPRGVRYIGKPPRSVRFKKGDRQRQHVWAVQGVGAVGEEWVALTVYVDDEDRNFEVEGRLYKDVLSRRRVLERAEAHLAAEAPAGFAYADTLLHADAWLVHAWYINAGEWGEVLLRLDARSGEVLELRRPLDVAPPDWLLDLSGGR